MPYCCLSLLNQYFAQTALHFAVLICNILDCRVRVADLQIDLDIDMLSLRQDAHRVLVKKDKLGRHCYRQTENCLRSCVLFNDVLAMLPHWHGPHLNYSFCLDQPANEPHWLARRTEQWEHLYWDIH
jgi:hypothetical protein